MAWLPSLPESSDATELENRLGLYQVFLKLYEHHRSLLDDILQLENLPYGGLGGAAISYIQAGVQDSNPYIMTNLIDGKTQRLLQLEGVWIIGRDRAANIALSEPFLSRHHAAIQYVKNEGYYLVDLGSTNGSYVNGEAIWQRTLLKDGDQIRLGRMAIHFFICRSSQTLEQTPKEILTQLKQASEQEDNALRSPVAKPQSVLPADEKSKDTSAGLRFTAPEVVASESSLTQLNLSQQAEILDRFFQQQMPVERN
jgi:pSer/pThr/pTyr-binding forkhead associated (FHA) protein